MGIKNQIIAAVVFVALWLCQCGGDQPAVQHQRQGAAGDVSFDLHKELHFKEIVDRLVDTFASLDPQAEFVRVDIDMPEQGLINVSALFHNEDKGLRFVCQVQDSELKVEEMGNPIIPPVFPVDKLQVDYADIRRRIDSIDDIYLREEISDMRVSHISIYNRVDTPCIQVKLEANTPPLKRVILYFNAETGEMYFIQRLDYR